MKKFIAGAVCFLALAGVTVQAQFNRHMRIINHASSSIRYLYASNIDRTNWEEDILGPFKIVLPGYYIDANIDDGSEHCRFDLRAVLADGREAVSRNVDVCSNDSWTITDSNR